MSKIQYCPTCKMLLAYLKSGQANNHVQKCRLTKTPPKTPSDNPGYFVKRKKP